MIQADGEGRRRRRLGDASQVRGRSVAGGGKECCRSGAKVSQVGVFRPTCDANRPQETKTVAGARKNADLRRFVS